MTIKEIRALTGLSQPKFCQKYHIPLNTFVRWEQGKREPPDYLVELLEFKVREDMGMENDLISKSELLKKMNDFCGSQRYLISEEVWKMVEDMPTYSAEKGGECNESDV